MKVPTLLNQIKLYVWQFTVFIIKIIPVKLGGPLLWILISLPYRLESIFSWLHLSITPRKLSLPKKKRLYLRPRTPPNIWPVNTVAGYSLDLNGWTPEEEPFETAGHEFFIDQQDANPEEDDEPTYEEDYQWGTRDPGVQIEDEEGVLIRDRFRQLYKEHRADTFKKDSHPGPDVVEYFESHRRRRRFQYDLGRLAHPGDAPYVFTREGMDEPWDGMYTTWGTLADWFFYAQIPTRTTTVGQWPEGFFHYLQFEHRKTWVSDPTVEPSRWARSTRGIHHWLFKTRRRRFSRKKKRFIRSQKSYLGALARVRKRVPKRTTPGAFPRRAFKTLRRRWYSNAIKHVLRINRWSTTYTGRTINPIIHPDESHVFANTRFNQESFHHRRHQLWNRLARLDHGIISRRKTRFFLSPAQKKKYLFNQIDTPDWFVTTATPKELKRNKNRTRWFPPKEWELPGRIKFPEPVYYKFFLPIKLYQQKFRHRSRVLPWTAPKWMPATTRGLPFRDQPPTGLGAVWIGIAVLVSTVFVLELLYLFAAFIFVPHSWVILGKDIHTWSQAALWPILPPYFVTSFHEFTWIEEPAEFAGDYFRKVSPGITPEWVASSKGDPRDRWTTQTVSYFGSWEGAQAWYGPYYWENYEDDFRTAAQPYGDHWWSHPGFGVNLIEKHFKRVAYPELNFIIVKVGIRDWAMQWLFGNQWFDKGNHNNGQPYFPYQDHFRPSWAHLHKKVGTFKHIYPDFAEFIRDDTAERHTSLRMIDHLYNIRSDHKKLIWDRLFDMFHPEGQVGITAAHIHNVENMVYRFFTQPVWQGRIIPEEGTNQWNLTYSALWESISSEMMWPSNRNEKRMRTKYLYQSLRAFDFRHRPHSEAWTLMTIVPEWETQLNWKTIQKWATPPVGDRMLEMDKFWTVWYIEIVEWWKNRFEHLFSYFPGILRWFAYLGGLIYFLSSSRSVTPQGVQVYPTHKWAPSGGIVSLTKENRRTLSGHVIARSKWSAQRYGRKKASIDKADDPNWDRSILARPEWNWTKQPYWRAHRWGWTRRHPSNNRRRLLKGDSINELNQIKTKGVQTIRPFGLGGGLGYHLNRWPNWRATSTVKSRTSTGFWSPRSTGQTWAWVDGISYVGKNTPDVESTFVRSFTPRRRRRRPYLRRGETYINLDGGKLPHRRRRRPRGWHAYSPRSTAWSNSVGARAGDVAPLTVVWKAPPLWFTRSLQRVWLHQKWSSTIGSLVVQPGSTRVDSLLSGANWPGRTTQMYQKDSLDQGYEIEWFIEDQANEIYDGHQPDEEDDWDLCEVGEEDFHEFRYLSNLVAPKVVLTDISQAELLLSYHRTGGLPRKAYFGGAPTGGDSWGGPLWGPLSVDHPYWGTLWTSYEVPRFYRRLIRWEKDRDNDRAKVLATEGRMLYRKSPRNKLNPRQQQLRIRRLRRKRNRVQYNGYSSLGSDLLWTSGVEHLRDEINLLGFSVRESINKGLDFIVDDVDGLVPGEPTLWGGAYRWSGQGVLRGVQQRPLSSHLDGRPVWAPVNGLNNWRYLTAESVGAPIWRGDAECLLMEGLFAGYNDAFEPEDIERDTSAVGDRDDEDYTDEGANFEEDNEEVPRTRPQDIPAWLVEWALAGVSPGDKSPAAKAARLSGNGLTVAGEEDVGVRAHRLNMRRYIRKGKKWVRRPWIPFKLDSLRYPKLSGETNDYLMAVSPHGPEDDPLIKAEAEHFVGSDIGHLDEDEEDEDEEEPQSELRLWALTEVYYGDYQTGPYIDH